MFIAITLIVLSTASLIYLVPATIRNTLELLGETTNDHD